MASEAQEREESADMSAGIYRKIDIPSMPSWMYGRIRCQIHSDTRNGGRVQATRQTERTGPELAGVCPATPGDSREEKSIPRQPLAKASGAKDVMR